MFSSSPPPEKDKKRRYLQKPTLPNLETSDTTRRSQIKKRLFERMFNYVETYSDKVLSKVLPDKAMKAVRTFSRGTKLLFADMKEYTWVNHVLTSTHDWKKACRTLSRKQLETYLYLPPELLKVAPVLILSAFPFAQNVVFPVALMYPKRLLSVHFYSPEQTMEDRLDKMKVRHSYYRPLLRDMQRMSSVAKKGDAFRKSLSILVNESCHPSVESIVKMSVLFEEGPFKMSQLKAPHAHHLLKCFGIKGFSWWFPRYRLQQHAHLVHEIDLALVREGGAEALSDDDLEKSCFLRGLSTRELSFEDKVDYVNRWLQVSQRISQRSMSLLLHLPILLGYNHNTRFWDDKSVV